MATGHGGNLRDLAARSGRDAAANPRLQRQRQSARPAGGPPRRLDRRLRAAGPLSRSAKRGVGQRPLPPRIAVARGKDRRRQRIERTPFRLGPGVRLRPRGHSRAVVHRLRDGRRARPAAAASRSFRWTSSTASGLDWDSLGSRVARGRIGRCSASRTTRRACPSTAASFSPSPRGGRQRRLSSTRPSPTSSTAMSRWPATPRTT